MRSLFFIIAIVLLFGSFVWGFFRKRIKKKTKLLQILGSAILIPLAVYLWFSPLWDYPKTTGPYEIASISKTYIDESRTETYRDDGSFRWLNTVFWYPSNYNGEENTLPFIVFSHGSFGVKESNESLYRELASQGYVVCAIDHTYQCLHAADTNGQEVGMDSAYMQQVMSASDKSPEKREQLYQLFAQWMKIRTGDINFIIDTVVFAAKADDGSVEGVYRLTDPSKIGVMGHSLGGAAALGIGRMRSDIKAVISLEAPFMCDVIEVNGGNFVWDNALYPVPVLNVYTDSSWHILGDAPQYAQNKALLDDDRTTTYEMYIKGAGHMTLTDLAYSMPPLCLFFGQKLFFDVERNVPKLNQNYLAFFDCFLKNKGTYMPIFHE